MKTLPLSDEEAKVLEAALLDYHPPLGGSVPDEAAARRKRAIAKDLAARIRSIP